MERTLPGMMSRSHYDNLCISIQTGTLLEQGWIFMDRVPKGYKVIDARKGPETYLGKCKVTIILERIKYPDLFGVDAHFIDQCVTTFQEPEIDILQEECGELIQACSKQRRFDTVATRQNLIEELAHVAISSACVAREYNITVEELSAEVEKKRVKHKFTLKGEE